MTNHTQKNTPSSSSPTPLPSPVTGDGSSLPLDEEVMDVQEMEPEGSPADDFEANARLEADEDKDFSSDENTSTGPPDAQYEEAEEIDDDDD
ncbi:MAG: hypothetical protein EOP87_25160 [Verrucomicrobiaceae bacterium]|nr:MAG: hypothetical protein EOP87_25160 [Verrucomicrobiaceae bacterium]